MRRRKKRGEEIRLDDMHFEGPNLDTPPIPDDLPYADIADWRNVQLLAANGIDADEDSLVTALETQTGVLLAAAAHAAGSEGAKGAIPQLLVVTQDDDDYAAVEAAYALARLGHSQGTVVLRQTAQREADLAPVLAAGYLARLGDPSGYDTVKAALDSQFIARKMLACKQLSYFLPFDGLALFERALADPNPSVQAEALVQLADCRPPQAKPLLEQYMGRARDEHLHQIAEQTLESLP